MDELQQSERLRGRRDLEFLPVEDSRELRWCVFDPISRQSFRIGYLEKWFLSHAFGSPTPLELLARFRRTHATRTESDVLLLSTIAQLANSGLLHRKQESLNAAKSSSPQVGSWISKLVVLQIRGVQPERFLKRIAPAFSFLFSVQAVVFWLLLTAVAILAVLLDTTRLSREIGSFDWLARPSGGGTLFLVFVLTRGLHEMGHALVCTRFGIRCPDIGIFAILGAPCVYCDVSESWKLTQRWKRAAVAAAGMYVELIVATLAAFVWLATADGALHHLAMQTMLVCSVGTIFINANPLMRFDGYYMLADWLDETNLRAKADSFARGFFKHWLMSAPKVSTNVSPALQRFFLLFSIAGMAYRTLLSISIAGVVIAMFHQWYLPWVGRFLAVAILLAWWSSPIMKLFSLFSSQDGQGRVRFAAAFGVGLALVMAIPVPSWRFADGWVEPRHARGVYAERDARLTECAVFDGDEVFEGDPLFTFSNSEIQIQRIRSEYQLKEAKNENEYRNYSNELNEGRGPPVRGVEAERAVLEGAIAQLESLEVVAPASGRLVAMKAELSPVPWMEQLLNGDERDHWCEPEQIGRTVRKGTLLAAVCSQESRAIIQLDRTQLNDVVKGTPVRLRFSHRNFATVDAEVQEVLELDRLGSMWHSDVKPQSDSKARPNTDSNYAAIVELPEGGAYLPGSSVDAVFHGEPKPVYSVIYRWLRTNLNLLDD